MNPMQQEMTRYFTAEKIESVFFVAAGVIAIAASIWMWRTGATLRGMGYPLVIIGLIQIFVGGAILLRTDRQVAELTGQLQSAPAAYQAAEIPRMQTVQRNFALYKWVEIALLLGGLGMSFLFRQNDLWYGVALGLILMSAVMLFLDLLAEHRGARYLEQVQALVA